MTAPRRYGLVLTLMVTALVITSAGATLAQDPDALESAGDAFIDGDLKQARSIYLRELGELHQLDAPTSATVLYNLGRVDQGLGANAQAVLWYRRALAAAPDDPWAQRNLEQLREQLGLPGPDPWQPMAVFDNLAARAAVIATVLLWGLLSLRWIAGRPRGWHLAIWVGVLAIGAIALLGGHYLAPQPAVLMSECSGPAGTLPAGSEVWLSQLNPARIWSSAGRFTCALDAPLLVASEALPPSLETAAPESDEAPKDEAASEVETAAEDSPPFV